MVFQKRVFLEVAPVDKLAQVPVEFVVNNDVLDSVNLKVEGECAVYKSQPVFHPGFSPGVTEVLCNVLESCQVLLQLEPDTKCMYICNNVC